jgi:hypothetical protein
MFVYSFRLCFTTLRETRLRLLCPSLRRSYLASPLASRPVPCSPHYVSSRSIPRPTLPLGWHSFTLNAVFLSTLLRIVVVLVLPSSLTRYVDFVRSSELLVPCYHDDARGAGSRV